MSELPPEPPQLPLFPLPPVDPVAARRAAEEGMARADAAERVQVWKLHADSWFERQPAGTTFQCDDLVAAIGIPDSGPGRNNVVGAWTSGKAKQRRIRWTGRFVPSRRIERHGNLNRVWVIT